MTRIESRGVRVRIDSANERAMNVEALRVAIGAVSVAYLATAALGTWLAIRDDLAGRPFGWETSLTPLESFVFGLGTALSAPLILVVALVAANLLMRRSRTPAARAAYLIALLGAGFFVGMLAEPITQDILDPGSVGPLPTAIVIANLLLPLALVLLAIRIRGRIRVRPSIDEAGG